MFGGFQPDAFQPNAYQHANADAFQCIAFQPFAFQNSCEIQPADAFQCIAFQPFAFQASCEVDLQPATDSSGGWPGFDGYAAKRLPKRLPREFEDLELEVRQVVEAVARRQVVKGPDLSPIQQLQELQAELALTTTSEEPEYYVGYFKFVRRRLEEEKAVALLLVTLLAQ